MGKDFRQFVIDYDICHTLIKESTINTFLREKPIDYLSKGEEQVIDDDDLKLYPIINNSETKESVNEILKEQLKEEFKEQSKTNNQKPMKNQKSIMIQKNSQ